MNYPLIIKILSRKASDAEREEFFSQCDTNPSLRDEYYRLKNLWSLSSDEYSLNKIEKFDSFWKKIERENRSRLRVLFTNVVKYAAIIIFTLSLGYLGFTRYSPDNMNTVQTFVSEKGGISTIQLKDGSKIWLNSGSKLDVVENSSRKVVSRLSGEAFFDIIHDESREYIVDLGKIRIRDRGTQFNLKFYEQDSEITAVLKEGVIDVENENGTRIVTMKPNTRFKYNKSNNTYNVEDINPELIAGWKDGKFVFISMSLRDICNELEKWYGIEIKINNPEIEDELYTSVLKRTITARHMMEMLKHLTGIKYEIIEDKNGNETIIID